MKKKEDLEAIVDLLYEWCLEYGERYASAYVINGRGTAGIHPGSRDCKEVEIFHQYREEPAICGQTGAGQEE